MTAPNKRHRYVDVNAHSGALVVSVRARSDLHV
jgi:hypothetical protein